MNDAFDIRTWFLALAPLSYSPGPANVLFAAMGAAFGFKASLPFLLGTISISLIQTALIGLGVGIAANQSRFVTVALNWGGVLVLLYFAFRFFRAEVANRAVSVPLSFREGVVLQILNGKFLLIPTVMFSLFLDPGSSDMAQVLGLTGALAALTLSANLLWVAGGRVLSSVVEEEWFAKVQGMIFGTILVATALWIALS
ncbi:MAG: LysE family transporter [Chromatiaceae bacterium]|nr:LysE family transporter [Gammaproteobacteria bacterium]MCP5300826.1 LysE family transporter [Chromatiaceae bacterium]MCP5421701.1 LysE family transporter [Chromatiaceae bacterium]